MPQKNVCCHHCGREIWVSTRAFSINCPSCNQRFSIEDFTFSSFHGYNRFETSGSIQVTPNGYVQAKLRARNLSIDGIFQGSAIADEKVALGSGARLNGDITAKRLEVTPGATIKGFFRIEP